MESSTLICKCRKVTYGRIEDAIHEHNDLNDVLTIDQLVDKTMEHLA